MLGVPLAPAVQGIAEAVLLKPVTLIGWDAGLGLALAAGLLVAVGAYLTGTFYGLLSQASVSMKIPIVAAAFLVGGAGGYLLAGQQPSPREPAASGPCSLGPWTAAWHSAQTLFDRLPADGSRGAFAVESYEPGEAWPSAPANAPESWGRPAITGVHWNTPGDRHVDWTRASASVHAEPDEDKLRIFVRLEGEGVKEWARELAVELLQRTTGASNATIEEATEHLGGDERVSGPWVERAYPRDLSLDLAGLVGDLGPDGWNVTYGPPIAPLPQAAEIYHSKANWTVNTLVPVTLAEGEVNGTAVRLAVSSTDHVALHVDQTAPLSDEAWDALAADVFDELGLGPAPERAWNPEASADC